MRTLRALTWLAAALALPGRAAAVAESASLFTTHAGDGWAVLAWVSGDVEIDGTEKYLVYRSADGGATYAPAGTTYADTDGTYSQSDSRGFWDQGLTSGTTYTYVVQSIDADSGTTAYSDPWNVTPLPGLADPFGTVFTESGNTFIRFLWNPTAAALGETDITQYRISRATGPAGPWQLVIANAPNSGVYVDAPLVNGALYWYMVQPQLPDRAPMLFSALPYLPARGADQPLARTDPAGPRAVRIAWRPAIQGTYPISRYEVYRSDDGGSSTWLVGSVFTGGPVQDPTCDRGFLTSSGEYAYVDCQVPTYGKRYLYFIRPVDDHGHLGDSYPTTIIDVILPVNRTYLGRNAFRPAQGQSEPVIWQVTESGHVRVTVMTQTGEVVRRLLDRDISGSFTADTPFNSRDRGLAPLSWDGTNERGEIVASGAYFVVLEINGKRDFRACAVIR